MHTGKNDNHHAALIHPSSCIILPTEQLLMAEHLKIAYGRSWKLRRIMWIREGEEVGL